MTALCKVTGLTFSLEEAYDRGRKLQYAVLMGRIKHPPRPNLHCDRLQEKLSLKEAVQLLRGLLLGYKLGAGHIYPGPDTIKHLRNEGGGNEQKTGGKS